MRIEDFFCFSVHRVVNLNWVLRHFNWVNTQIRCLSVALDIAENRFRTCWKPVTNREIPNEIGTTTCRKETARNFDIKRYALDFPGIAYRRFLLRFLMLPDRYELHTCILII